MRDLSITGESVMYNVSLFKFLKNYLFERERAGAGEGQRDTQTLH